MISCSQTIRASLWSALLVLCIGGAVAHPYPSRHSTHEDRSARRNRIRMPSPPVVNRHQLDVHGLYTNPSPSEAHPSHTNATESHSSHLSVPHSPLPATIGGGRTLPTSAFYPLKFTLSTNSSQRNVAKNNSTSSSNLLSAGEHSPSATAAHQSRRIDADPSPTAGRPVDGSIAFSSHDNTLDKVPKSSQGDEQPATSRKEKTDDIFSALRFDGLWKLVSSMKSAKRASTDVTDSDERHEPISGEEEQKSKNIPIPKENVSVKMAGNITLSDIIEMIMSESQKEADSLTATSKPQNDTLSSRNTSQVSPNNSSLGQKDVGQKKETESQKKNEKNANEVNTTHDASNSSYRLEDKVPHKAIEIIQKLHVLVHLVNQTGSEKDKRPRSESHHANLRRPKQPDELLQLAKRYVMNLYRTMFLEGASVKNTTGNSTVVLKSLAANARFSGDVEGIESDDVDDSESENEGPGSEWGDRQETQTTPSPSAQVSLTPDNKWGERLDTQTQATPSTTVQGSSSESVEDIRTSSDGEDQHTERSEGNVWTSSAAASPALSVPEAMGASSAGGGQSGGDGEGDTGTNASTSAQSPSITVPPGEGDNVASNDPEVGLIPSSPSPSASAAAIPPMAVPMSAESGTRAKMENNYGVRDGENVTQLADMVYKLVREEGVFSMAVAPCDEVTDWMPGVVRRLREELVELQFYCIDTRMPVQDMSPLKRVFGDVATGFVQVGADNIKESIPAELDMVVSWKGLQRWGMERGWHFLRGLRDSGAKFVLVSNNPGIMNMEDSERAVNVRSSPLLFGEPRRVIGGVTQDNSVQLLLYAMDDIRDGF